MIKPKLLTHRRKLRVLFILALFLLIVAAYVAFRVVAPSGTGRESVYIESFRQGTEAEIKFTGLAPDTTPYIQVAIGTVDGKIFGQLNPSLNGESIKWDGSYYLNGDIANNLKPGIYKLNAVGYKEIFCEELCPLDAKRWSDKIFEAWSPIFVIAP